VMQAPPPVIRSIYSPNNLLLLLSLCHPCWSIHFLPNHVVLHFASRNQSPTVSPSVLPK
jgi:hypothetical protein